MTENEIRQRVVGAAMSHVDAVRGNAEHHKILYIYNSRKPLPRGYRMTDRDAWCAATASAIAIETGNDDIVPIECSCSRMIAQAKEMGIWVEADNHVPKPADLILYDWDDDGRGECTGAPEHIGTVVRVGGGKITVMEGNMRGGKAGTRPVPANGRYIRGFICPDYASKATPAPRPVDGKKSNIQIVAEVLDGLWGNQPDRQHRLEAAGYDYATIRDMVNSGNYKSLTAVAHDVIDLKYGVQPERQKLLEAAGYDYDTVADCVNAILR